MRKIDRRTFCKIGCTTIAALPFTFSGVAQSQEVEVEDEVFRSLVKNYYPIRQKKFKLKFNKETVKIVKTNGKGDELGKDLIVNGRGATILQLCKGFLNYDNIVELYSMIYT